MPRRHVLTGPGAGAVVLLAALGASPSPANETTSAYTSLDFDSGCAVTDAPREGEPAGWVRLECDGYADHPVHVVEDDLRMAIPYGGAAVPGRWQDFFRGFSDVHDVIEWRLHAPNGREPFATIHRWYVTARRGTAEGKTLETREILVLSTVATEPGEVSCVMGYVDARLNPDANDLARAVVDKSAADFRCDTDDPAWYGASGAE